MSSNGARNCNDVIATRLSGSAFHILAAATGKAQLPTVESLKGGTTVLNHLLSFTLLVTLCQSPAVSHKLLFVTH